MTTDAQIFIVDDDEAVRDSLAALLEARGYSVSTSPSAEDFLTSFRPPAAGCALVDMRMPGMDGLALLARFKAQGATLPMIMVTGHGDVPLAVSAMKAGAFDFIEKPYSNDAILDVIRRAVETSRHAGSDNIVRDEARARIDSLTPRERAVLDQLVIGNANKVIAYELQISPRTVEIYRANVMKKMQADSLPHLVRMALAAGITAKNA